MKHTNLSNFQKEQYTAYLQTQLQKFSAFMLCQKKQNQQIRECQSVARQHSNLIQQLQHKLEIVEFYQKEIVKNQENLFKKHQNSQEFENRVRRLEDRERFDCDREARRQRERRQQEKESQRNGSSYVNLNKRLKVVEDRIIKLKENDSLKLNNISLNNDITDLIDDHTHHKVKKAEKKLKKYFKNKFQDIEQIIKKQKSKRSKSPLTRTPIQMSTMSRYEIQQSVLPSTQFRLSDYDSSKQEASTILRDSKNTTISNKNKVNAKDKNDKKKEKKNKNKQNDKSRSKSKSQRKERSKSAKRKDKKRKNYEKSVSYKSRDISYSQNLSDNSFMNSSISKSRSKSKSCLSRSKSNLSKDAKYQKQKSKLCKKQKRKINLSHSKSKSNHSYSPSVHQHCKKRPQILQLQPYTQHMKKSKQKSMVLNKRKYI